MPSPVDRTRREQRAVAQRFSDAPVEWERGAKKKEKSEMPSLKERTNEGKSTHTSAADFTV